VLLKRKDMCSGEGPGQSHKAGEVRQGRWIGIFRQMCFLEVEACKDKAAVQPC
jgi:hypothetical protein